MRLLDVVVSIGLTVITLFVGLESSPLWFILLGAPTIGFVLLSWRHGTKPDSFEWHILEGKPPASYRMIAGVMVCGRWKYIGSVPMAWCDVTSWSARRRARALEKKGITPTYFRICQGCGQSEDLRHGYSVVTLDELLRRVKEDEETREADAKTYQTRKKREERERVERKRQLVDDRPRALQWLKEQGAEQP